MLKYRERVINVILKQLQKNTLLLVCKGQEILEVIFLGFHSKK